jgi:hypothetical protein
MHISPLHKVFLVCIFYLTICQLFLRCISCGTICQLTFGTFVSASLLKWFTTFFQNYYKSSLWRFVVRGTKALDALKQDKYGGLCDSKRNTHLCERVVLLCVMLFNVELNLVSFVVCSAFYSSRLDSYIVTQCSTSGLMVVGSLCSRTLLGRSGK